ncbi:MAG: FAD-dependent oxidoreductase [Elusimicrobia bacterium]|nr:FAD-dependent oxidoreductase [Elusimicrobiota bacterium]
MTDIKMPNPHPPDHWRQGFSFSPGGGDSYVVVDSEDVEKRARCIIPSVQRAAAFVYPADVDQLQKVLRIATDHRIPLWPCGKGKNWGYGSATPAKEGAVVVVLERMNRILEVNETLAYAVVEPGVTYRQLHEHLQKRGIQLWLDCTDGPADGSVMGNALERGIGETPYGDHFENICGMEVLLPDGKLLRTGGAPLKITKHGIPSSGAWGRTSKDFSVNPTMGLSRRSDFGSCRNPSISSLVSLS